LSNSESIINYLLIRILIETFNSIRGCFFISINQLIKVFKFPTNQIHMCNPVNMCLIVMKIMFLSDLP